jgi:hypothetical protein
MGVALEWFGEEDRRSIAEGLLDEVEVRNGKVWAACPFHAEQSAGGAFFYDPAKDHAFCFSCRSSEDLVGVFCAVSGFPPNSVDGFRAFRERFAPGRPVSREVRPAERAGPRQPARWTAEAKDLPPVLWSEKAEEFVRKSADRLAGLPEVLDRLAAWGIDADTAAKCRIGWCDRDRYRKRTDWGLPVELKPDGTPKKLWLPEGLVLPFYAEGRVARIKIRREHPERGPEKVRKIKYYKVPGGCERMFVYGRPSCRVWAVVEAERDAAMLWGRVRDLGVGAVATGSASSRPDAATHAILARADMLLVAFDNDGPEGAGAVQSRWWLDHFPFAVRWPVPPAAGKDPGDAIGPGLDVRAWVLAGLPQHVQMGLTTAARRRTRPVAGPALPEGPADARNAAAVAPGPPVQVLAPEESGPLPVALGEPFPEDIPGLDFRDEELADLWNLLPADYPGKRAYFRLLGLLFSYPARGVRVRKRGAGTEMDGLALRIDESWRRANPDVGREISRLFWGEANALWLDWNWRTAPVEWEEEEVKECACGATTDKGKE